MEKWTRKADAGCKARKYFTRQVANYVVIKTIVNSAVKSELDEPPDSG